VFLGTLRSNEPLIYNWRVDGRVAHKSKIKSKIMKMIKSKIRIRIGMEFGAVFFVAQARIPRTTFPETSVNR
jgi:hypothetical protein